MRRGGKGGEIRERGEKGTEKGEGDGDREGRRDKEEELGMSMFRFFVIEQFVFYCPSEKKLCFVSFLFEIQKPKNVSKYFDIEKDFFKTFNQFFFRFSLFVFVWERFVSSKQNFPNTTNLILSNWLNSMVVRLDISSNFFKNKPLLLFRSNPRRF